MYISPRALEGGRRHRMVVGGMLFGFVLFFAVVLTVVAVRGAGGSVLVSVGFGAVAVSLYPLAWWCARFWYAAFSEGRSAEPVAEPGSWPWLLPPLVIGVALGVTGVRALIRGESEGWFALGMAVLFGGPSAALVVVGLWSWVSSRRVAGDGSAVSAPAAEPTRPRRDWGPIG